jgi:phosphoglycerol transferase
MDIGRTRYGRRVQARDDLGAGPDGPDVPPRSRRRQALVEYAGAAAAATLAGFVLLRLWHASLHVPFDYHGDALYFEMMVKAVADHGWFLTNPSLGAPGVLAMHDFPSADWLHLLVCRILSWGISDWAVVYNLYFLLGFPLITVAALAVFRHFGVGYAPAAAGSVLYAFLPTRLLMGEGHYFLSIFYEVPLAILVALWVASDDPPIGPRRSRRRMLTAIAICALTAGTGIYYAFFAGALIALGGIWGALRWRSRRNLLAGLMLTGVIMTGLGLQALPNAAYHWRHGPNRQVAERQTGEAEVLGMRIAQLLLPPAEHRVRALANLKWRYDAAAPFPGETSTTSLGLFGSCGFLVLLGAMLLPVREGRPRAELWRALALLNLLALLLATTGGFGSLFAVMVTPIIRTYARMSVFIGFLGMFATVLLLERFTRRLGPFRGAVCGLVMGIGLLDQVTPPAVRHYARWKTEYDSDGAFVRAVEAAVPPHAMILELPYQAFPEGGASSGGVPLEYSPVRMYLHSRSLRWSFPAMRGRPVDTWIERVTSLPPAEMVRAASDAGFDGIVINRWGYADKGAKIEGALREVLGPDAAGATAPVFSFFSLVEYNRQAQAAVSPELRAWRREEAAHPLFLRWLPAFYENEKGPNGTFRWSMGSGAIEIDNDAPTDRQVTLTMNVFAANPPVTLSIDGDLLSETATVGAPGLPIARALTLRPGVHVIRMRAAGKRADSPRDSRRLIWRVENPILEPLPGAPP